MLSGAPPHPTAVVLEASQPLTLPTTARLIRLPNGFSSSGATQYMLTDHDIQALPQGDNAPLSDALAQMPGVSYDRNGLIHVRGWAIGNVQYEVNGVMLPLNIYNNSGFVQVLNSFMVKDVSLLDGILPAQYGFENDGVVKLTTKDGCSAKGGNFNLYGGMRETAQPSFELAGCHDKFSYYVQGMYEHNDIGFSSATPGSTPIHDVSNLGEGFGYFTYDLTPETRLSLTTGVALWNSQFPNSANLVPQYELDGFNPAAYPSTDLDNNFAQRDYWSVLALKGLITPNLSYQLAYSFHYQGQHYIPDSAGDLIYQGAAPDAQVEGLANAVQGDFTYQLGAAHTVKGGFYFGAYDTTAQSYTLTFPVNSQGVQTSNRPIGLESGIAGLNLVSGSYLQDTWRVSPRWSVNFGGRFDRLTGFASGQQLSPSINFIYRARENLILHAGFARYFQVPNFFALSPSAFSTFANTSAGYGLAAGGAYPKPERDWYWDVGGVYHITPHLAYQHDDYFRLDRDYLDYGFFSYIPIDIPFNFERGYGWGTENSISYSLKQLMFHMSLTVGKERQIGVATGQYNFSQQELSYIKSHYITLDHEPLVGINGGASYRWRRYLFSIDGVYGSGYVGGFANTQQEPAWWWLNCGLQRTFSTGWLGNVTDRIIIQNMFDRTNLLRPQSGIGIFQAMYAPRLAVYNAISIPLPPL